MFTALLVTVSLALGQDPVTPAAQSAPIADNSFLVEEAYNQEPGVVQHISTFAFRQDAGDWVYAFTEEWPINRFPRSQFSYTVALVSNDRGAGLGDLLLHWRFQALDTGTLAAAPRFSVSIPTGQSDAGRGAGGIGLQFALPVSVSIQQFAFHSNLVATLVPHAPGVDRTAASTVSVLGAEGVVWLVRPRFNALVEIVASRTQSPPEGGRRAWDADIVLSPGVRWAHNLRNGLQIVPGVAIPLQLDRDARGEWSLLGYFSLEHPFGKAR